jgi:hypothetical protein
VIDQGGSAAGVGDDAQLLAGATMALHAAPHRYEAVTRLLNDALDLSFDMDAVFGRPAPHRVFIPSQFMASPGYRFYKRGAGRRASARWKTRAPVSGKGEKERAVTGPKFRAVSVRSGIRPDAATRGGP